MDKSAAKIVQQDPAKLTPYAKNAKVHKQADIDKLAGQIAAFGFDQPILVDGKGVIIKGHKRREAAMQLGLKWVPTLVSARDEYDNMANRLADNAVVGTDYDDSMVQFELGTLRHHNYDLRLTGFELGDLEKHLATLGDTFAPDPGMGDGHGPGDSAAEPAPPPEDARALGRDKGPSVCQLGDVWELGEHRLHCADVKDLEHDTVRAAALLTDPPYGISQPGVPNDGPDLLQGIVAAGVAAAQRVLAADSISVVFQSTRTFPVWLNQYLLSGQKFERMLWLYKEAQCTFPWRGWILTSEAILIFSHGKPQWQQVRPFAHDCYKVSEVSNELVDDLWHGSVKPMRVVLDLLQRVSAPGDWVFDPFCGSGTSLMACESANRKCLACEIDPHYCDVIIRRWEDFTKKKAVKRGAQKEQPCKS